METQFVEHERRPYRRTEKRHKDATLGIVAHERRATLYDNMQPIYNLTPTKRILAGAGLALLVIGGGVATVMTGMLTPLAGAVTLVAGSIGGYGASTRQHWGRAGVRALAGVVVVASVASGVADGVWAISVVGIGTLAWFFAHTMYNYMRPAGAIPGAVQNLIERHITLSEESIAGVKLGVRAADGAVFGVIYAGKVTGKPGDSKRVQKAVRDAKNARDIIARSQSVEANLIAVAGGSFATETIEGIVVCDGEHFGKAVAAVRGPDRETLVEIAKANGIQLNRNQTRRVVKRQGNNGKKIVHQGRITKVAP
jgi:hypothetical protein